MKIRWYGHSCFQITGNRTLVTDPHDGKSLGLSPPHMRADVIIVSHDHFDHSNTQAVVSHTPRLVDIMNPRYSEPGISIRGFPSYHDEDRGRKLGRNCVFTIRMDGTRMVFSGDLGHMPGKTLLNSLGKPHILFVPTGERYTLDIKRVWEFVDFLEPAVVVPMHFGIPELSIELTPVEDFLKARNKSRKEHLVRDLGHSHQFVEFPSHSRPEIWLFRLG